MLMINNCDLNSLCTGRKSIHLDGLFYAWWCMSYKNFVYSNRRGC